VREKEKKSMRRFAILKLLVLFLLPVLSQPVHAQDQKKILSPHLGEAVAVGYAYDTREDDHGGFIEGRFWFANTPFLSRISLAFRLQQYDGAYPFGENDAIGAIHLWKGFYLEGGGGYGWVRSNGLDATSTWIAGMRGYAPSKIKGFRWMRVFTRHGFHPFLDWNLTRHRESTYKQSLNRLFFGVEYRR
jgi:hypothetical protein